MNNKRERDSIRRYFDSRPIGQYAKRCFRHATVMTALGLALFAFSHPVILSMEYTASKVLNIPSVERSSVYTQVSTYVDINNALRAFRLPETLEGLLVLLLLLVLAVVVIWNTLRGFYWLGYILRKPSDKRIDGILAKDLSDLVTRSLDKIGLEESELRGEPIVLIGFGILELDKSMDRKTKLLHFREGKDGTFRFLRNRIVIIQLAQNFLAVYQCDHNLLNDVALNEQFTQCQYAHITTMSIKEKSYEADGVERLKEVKSEEAQKIIQFEQFELSLSGNEKVGILVQERALVHGKAPIPVTSVEKAVRVIRTMLKEESRKTD